MYDIIIVGAGVIGSSIARELSRYKLKIGVFDKGFDLASGTTKANSGIVHAGFDAKMGSLKARFNVEGNKMFDKLSRELDFPFRRTGSLVLCFNEKDIFRLQELKAQGEKNGVCGLKILNKEELRELEPNISEETCAALLAPTGGIVCPYEMTIAYAENAYDNGVDFKLGTEVFNIDKKEEEFIIKTSKGTFYSKVLINAAGVFSDSINNMLSKNKISIIPRKGEYFLLDKAVGNLVNKTIFQLPTNMGKGVLVTPTVDGNILVGPNAQDIEDREDFTTTRLGLDEIIQKSKMSIKALPLNNIITSFSGLRAHSKNDDFIIGESEDVSNLINAAGIESPGLTSAPAIAVYIKEIVEKKLKPQVNENFKPIRKGIVKFRELSNEERAELIAKRPEYGKIVCRCETITEGEIIDAIKRPLGATTLDGIKRRTRAGMGRCQGGFCTTRIVDILSKELNIDKLQITKFGGLSYMLTGENKDAIR